VTVAVPAKLDGVKVTVAAPPEAVFVVPVASDPAPVVPAADVQVIVTPGSLEPSCAVIVTGAEPATKVVPEELTVIAPGVKMDWMVKVGPE